MYRQWHTRVNWVLVFITLLLILLGLVTIYSATFRDEGFSNVWRQLFSFGVGSFLSLLIFWIGYKKLCTFEIKKLKLAYCLYGLSLLLLVVVLKKGESALGAQRWIRFGPLGSFQPSEFAKLGVLLALATYYSEVKEPLKFKSLLVGAVMTGLPLLLVLIQPDLGTSIIMAAIFAMIMYFLGMKPVALLTSAVASGAFLFKIMKPYQRERLLIFLNPQQDPQGGGWNILQSLIAVGSGRVAGKGLFAGTQTQLKFVPEHSTDFIFTVIAEELGFLGAAIVLLFYFILLWQGIQIAMETEDRLGRLLACGIVTMLFFHVLINVGMTIGIMPITGIPLPFVSSGGTSLVTNMAAISILLNIEYNRHRVMTA